MKISGEQFMTNDNGDWELCAATVDGKRFNKAELQAMFKAAGVPLPKLAAPSPNDDHPKDGRFPDRTSLRSDIESALNQFEE